MVDLTLGIPPALHLFPAPPFVRLRLGELPRLELRDHRLARCGGGGEHACAVHKKREHRQEHADRCGLQLLPGGIHVRVVPWSLFARRTRVIAGAVIDAG